MATTGVSRARSFRFGKFELNVQAGELRRDGWKVRIEGQPLRLLLVLLERRGEMVTREELRQELWPDGTFVDFEHGINAAVKRLRRALDDPADNPRFIATLPRRGYRFIAPCEVFEAGAGEHIPDQPPRLATSRLLARRMSLLVVASFCVAAALLLIGRIRSSASHAPRLKLAVLPFANLTGNTADDYLCDGLTEEIITELGQLQPDRLGVIARSSTLRYKSSRKNIAEIGGELGVDYVVEGSVLQAPPQLRINVQLIRVRDQMHVWAQMYEREPADTVSLLADVRENTARVLSVPARRSEAGERRVNRQAHEAYLRGQYSITQGTGPAVDQARQYFEEAIRRDPEYAQAYAGLALAYTVMGNYGILPQTEAKPKAKEIARQALQLDPSLVDARVTLASVMFEYDWNFANAEKELKYAVDHSPNSALAHLVYSLLLSTLGRSDLAVREMEKAYELDPATPRVGVDLGRTYYWAHHYEQAIAQFRAVLAMQPNYAAAHSELGRTLLEKQQFDEAIAEIKKGLSLIPGNDGFSVWLGYAYGRAGKKSEAQQALTVQLAHRGEQHIAAMAIAMTYVGLNDREKALAWLETAYRERDNLAFLKCDPPWDPLRGDPRFRDLVRRIGLPN